MIAAVDAAEAEQAEEAAEPIAGPSGLCGQQLSAAPSQDATFIDAMEEVCTIYTFVNDCIGAGIGAFGDLNAPGRSRREFDTVLQH